MERRINRGQQGDIGEASAIEWLTRMGAVVLIPIGRSPDFDLVASVTGGLLRIQVKTSTQRLTTPAGDTRRPSRWRQAVATGVGTELGKRSTPPASTISLR
jgi:Holliday junction resolvase-like predicted endonuclease